MAAIKSLQKEKGNLLLLDAGECIFGGGTNSQANAEFVLNSMDNLGYAALNLGVGDFAFGLDFLKESKKKIHFPLVASNLVLPAQDAPLAEKYLIKNVDGIKVGILGVVSPDNFQIYYRNREIAGVSIAPSVATLQTLVPEVRKQADLVILLADCGFDTTRQLVQEVPGVDLAIAASGPKTDKQWLAKPSGPAVVTVAFSGEELGVLEISMAGKHQVEDIRASIVELGHDMAQDPDAKQLVENTYGPQTEVQVIPQVHLKAAVQPIDETQQKQLLQLSPEQYLERLKQQTGDGGAGK